MALLAALTRPASAFHKSTLSWEPGQRPWLGYNSRDGVALEPNRPLAGVRQTYGMRMPCVRTINKMAEKIFPPPSPFNHIGLFGASGRAGAILPAGKSAARVC